MEAKLLSDSRHSWPQNPNNSDSGFRSLVINRMPLMDESSVAGANVTGIHTHQWVLSESSQAVFQGLEIRIRLQFPELMERIDVNVVEVPLRCPRELILAHGAVAASPAAQSR